MAVHSTKISTASFHYAAVNFKMKVLPRLYLCNELRHDPAYQLLCFIMNLNSSVFNTSEVRSQNLMGR